MLPITCMRMKFIVTGDASQGDNTILPYSEQNIAADVDCASKIPSTAYVCRPAVSSWIAFQPELFDRLEVLEFWRRPINTRAKTP